MGISGIIQIVGGLVLRIMDLIVRKVIKDIEAQERFMAFVASMSKHNASAAKLNQSYQKQLEELKKKWNSSTTQPQKK